MRKKMPSWGYEFCIYQFFQGMIVTEPRKLVLKREGTRPPARPGGWGGDLTLNRPKEVCVSVNIDK